jgi:hypothetical protein
MALPVMALPVTALPVLRSNVEWLKARFYERVGNDYVTFPPGPGVWSPTDTSQGCDCSALAAHVLNGVLYGPHMQWQRIDPATTPATWITTESWRPIEYFQAGPFGTIDLPSDDFPADAVVKIAIHHGNGPDGHMWVECDGVRMESNGTNGCVTGGAAPPDVLARSRGPARSVYDTSDADDWAYLAGPIIDDIGGAPIVVAQPITLPKGVDYSAGRPGGKALRDAGFGFACRYLTDGGGGMPNKRLTPEEARDLQANGVQVVSNWESTAGRMLSGYQAGRDDAAAADDWHRRCGGPPSRPIYFSADIEVITEEQQGAVNDYLRGCGEVIGVERVGLYGGYQTCKRAWDVGLVRWLWQTETWSHGNVHPKIHILQRLPVPANQTYVNGVQCDTNETRQPDYGQWVGGGPLVVQPADPDAWPLPRPPQVYWGPQHGPDDAWSNLEGSEPPSSRAGLIRWQTALGFQHPSGVFDADTKAAAILCQQSHGWAVTGNVYKGEWDAVIKEGWRLPGGVPLPMTGILRANIEYAINIFTERIGSPYLLGGVLDRNNRKAPTDCSGLVWAELEALFYGVTNMDWTHRGTTESWPYDYTNNVAAAPDTKGPYGTICAGGAPDGLAAIPGDAVAIIPIMHGGGGASSHMEIQVRGVLMESGGNHNNVPSGASGSIGGAAQGATALNSSIWTDYWYLPGPIIESTLPGPVTLPPVTPGAPPDYLRLIYEQLLGPVREDGYGHGWEKLGTNDQGQNLTLVDFLAKYKPVLDALLDHCGAADTKTPSDNTPTKANIAAPHTAILVSKTEAAPREATQPAKKAAARKPNPRLKKAAPQKATQPAEQAAAPKPNPHPKKAAPRKATSRKA